MSSNIIEVKKQEHDSGRIKILEPSGKLNLYTVSEFKEELKKLNIDIYKEELTKGNCPEIGPLEILALDLNKLSELDSTGFGILIRIMRWTSKLKIELFFLNPNESILRLFEKFNYSIYSEILKGEEFKKKYLNT